MAKRARSNIYALPRTATYEELRDDILGGACDDGLEEALAELGVTKIMCDSCGSVCDSTTKLDLVELLAKAMRMKRYALVMDFFARWMSEVNPPQLADLVQAHNRKYFTEAKAQIVKSAAAKGDIYDDLTMREYDELLRDLDKAIKSGQDDWDVFDRVDRYIGGAAEPLDLYDIESDSVAILDGIMDTDVLGSTDKEKVEKLIALFPFADPPAPAKKKSKKK